MEASDLPSLFNSDGDNCMENKPKILNFTLGASGTTKKVNVDKKPVVKRESLTTKNAMKYLLEGCLRKKVCRYCLNVASPLSELDQVLQVAGSGKLFKVTIRDMVATFYPYKVAPDPNFPNKICNKCLNQTIKSYLFTQQCERSERALKNCFEDMYSKLEKLDPLEPQKKRGRQKINPNHNVLFTDHEKVINYAEPLIHIVNSGTELTEQVTDNKFECPKCWQILPNMESLLNHETQHPKSMWYNCHHCGKSFTKRNVLKKHIRTAHDLGKQVQQPKTDFKCSDCGVVSEKFNKHIQHIEKHKFQMIMEHLMERNMNKLCAVCLDNKQKLADLDDMVCLHGGFPEMMGERSLYSIIGSTVPDKSSYKYRELLIPNHAKVISLFKIADHVKSHDFALSSPIVLSNEEAYENTKYVFIFCSPNNLNVGEINDLGVEAVNADEIENNDEDSDRKTNDLGITNTVINSEDINYDHGNDIQTLKNTDTDDSLNLVDISEESNVKDKIVYQFSKPDYVDEVITVDKKIKLVMEFEQKETCVEQNSSVKQSKKPCNVCWIFKKPSCENCLKVDIDSENPIIYKDQQVIKNKQCQFPWVFKNCPCENCKKENKNFNYENRDNDTGMKCGNEIKIKYNDSEKLKSNNNKRKITDDIKPTSKKVKWQCKICLSANVDRNLCLCCDAQRYSCDDSLKVKFNFNKDFLKTLNENSDKTFTVETKTYDFVEEAVDVNKNIEHLGTQASFTETPVNIINTTSDSISHVFNNNFERTSTSTDDFKLHLASTSNEHPKLYTVDEEMDIVEDDHIVSTIPVTQAIIHAPKQNEFQSVINMPSNDNDTYSAMHMDQNPADSFLMCAESPNPIAFGNQTPAFQFNIGATPTEDRKMVRRVKKPLRRSAFHK